MWPRSGLVGNLLRAPRRPEAGSAGPRNPRVRRRRKRVYDSGGGSDVRIPAGQRPFSTDPGTFFRPHPGDREVVQIASTGATADTPSPQVNSLWICGHRCSTACGRILCPQPVGEVFHRRPTGLDPLSPASPQPCPLFGNETPGVTGASESRHTKETGWAVGNRGKAGDRAGENYPCPVHGMCRTFGRPQKPRVVHRCHPQGQWTKNWA